MYQLGLGLGLHGRNKGVSVSYNGLFAFMTFMGGVKESIHVRIC